LLANLCGKATSGFISKSGQHPQRANKASRHCTIQFASKLDYPH
jgi:hypothetical protein